MKAKDTITEVFLQYTMTEAQMKDIEVRHAEKEAKSYVVEKNKIDVLTNKTMQHANAYFKAHDVVNLDLLTKIDTLQKSFDPSNMVSFIDSFVTLTTDIKKDIDTMKVLSDARYTDVMSDMSEIRVLGNASEFTE